MGSLGWAEILMILVIALIIFGPRKLPELGKSLGQSLAQFRKASEDFKRTWEEEVELEKRRLESYDPGHVESSSVNETVPYDSWEAPPETGTTTAAETHPEGTPHVDAAADSGSGAQADAASGSPGSSVQSNAGSSEAAGETKAVEVKSA